MKKSLIVFASASALLLAGCGKKEETKKPKPVSYKTEQTSDYLLDAKSLGGAVDSNENHTEHYTLYATAGEITPNGKTSTIALNRLTNPYEGTNINVTASKLPKALKKYSPIKMEIDAVTVKDNGTTYTAKKLWVLSNKEKDDVVRHKYLGTVPNKKWETVTSENAHTWNYLAVMYNKNHESFMKEYNGKTVAIAAPISEVGGVSDRKTALGENINQTVDNLLSAHKSENKKQLTDYLKIQKYYQMGQSFSFMHKATAGYDKKELKQAGYKLAGSKFDDTDQQLTYKANGDKALVAKIASLEPSGGTPVTDKDGNSTVYPNKGATYVLIKAKLAVDSNGISIQKFESITKINEEAYKSLAESGR